MFKPEGVYVAMLTPFDEDGSINEGELRRIVDFQIAGGVHGLFPISSAGEFIHMSRDEKVRMMEIMVDQNKGRVKITPGVGSSLPAESIFLAQKGLDHWRIFPETLLLHFVFRHPSLLELHFYQGQMPATL